MKFSFLVDCIFPFESCSCHFTVLCSVEAISVSVPEIALQEP